MKYEISPDRSQLIISIDDDEQKVLSNMDELDSDNAMYDFLDSLIANSELSWLRAEDTGDLTDAPILGILGEETVAGEGFTGPHGFVLTGGNGGETCACPILERWGFSKYQIVSVLEELKRHKKVVFQNSW